MVDTYKRVVLFALVALLLLLSVLSMSVMRTSAFWYDEILSFMCAGGGQYGPTTLTQTVDCVHRIEASPPSYHIFLKAWGTVAGWSEFSGWMLSLSTGLIAVASMYRLGYDLFIKLGKQSAQVIGISAAVALGMSAFFIQFLFELRFYIFIVLETIWFIDLYWRIIRQNNPSGSLQAAFVVSVAALLYVHYTTVCILGAVALYHLLTVKKNREWWRVPLLMLAGSLLFLPWLSALFGAVDQVANFPSSFRRTPVQMAELVTYAFSNSNVGLLALIGIFALGALLATRQNKQAACFVWSIFIISLLLGLLMVVVLPYINRPRYLLYLWPVAALLVGLGIEQLRQRRVNPTFILLIWTAAGLWNFTNPSADNMDRNLHLPWHDFRNELRSNAQTGDVVLFHTPIDRLLESLEFKHYTYGLPSRGSLTENIPGKLDNDEYFDEISKFIADAPRLWLGVEQSTVPNFRMGEVQRILKANYAYCYTAFDLPWFMRLELYIHKHPAPVLRFGDQGNQVDIARLSPLKPDAKRTLPVLLSISHTAALPIDTYSIALHIEDSQGHLLAQDDFGIPSDVDSCHQAVVPLKDLPPGVYTLRTIVYEWRNGQRLAGQVVATGTNDNSPVLGQITIAQQ